MWPLRDPEGPGASWRARTPARVAASTERPKMRRAAHKAARDHPSDAVLMRAVWALGRSRFAHRASCENESWFRQCDSSAPTLPRLTTPDLKAEGGCAHCLRGREPTVPLPHWARLAAAPKSPTSMAPRRDAARPDSRTRSPDLITRMRATRGGGRGATSSHVPRAPPRAPPAAPPSGRRRRTSPPSSANALGEPPPSRSWETARDPPSSTLQHTIYTCPSTRKEGPRGTERGSTRNLP